MQPPIRRRSPWRPDATAAATVNVSGPGGSSGKIELPAGQSAGLWAGWPGGHRRQPVQIELEGAKAPTAVKFIVIKPSLPARGYAQSLIKSGCNAQLDLLIQTTALPAGNTAG